VQAVERDRSPQRPHGVDDGRDDAERDIPIDPGLPAEGERAHDLVGDAVARAGAGVVAEGVGGARGDDVDAKPVRPGDALGVGAQATALAVDDDNPVSVGERAVHQAGERRRLAGAGEAGDEDVLREFVQGEVEGQTRRVGSLTAAALQVGIDHPNQAHQVAQWAETTNADTERWLLTTRTGRLVNSLVVEPACILADPNASDAEKLLAAGQLALFIPGSGAVVGGVARFVLRPVLRGAGKLTGKLLGLVRGTKGVDAAALDANALIRGLDFNELAAVDAALAGRVPVISIRAAREYLMKGDINALRDFLQQRGGRMGSAGTAEQISLLQEQARVLGRVISFTDAEVAASAIREGIPLIARDKQLIRFLQAAGYTVETF